MNPRIHRLREGVVREAPTILTVFGVTGLVTTTIFTIRGTIEAVAILAKEREAAEELFDGGVRELEFKEKMGITWKCYIPTAICGTFTAACILGANSINLKRNAALAGVYAVAVEGLREYQGKVIETLGKKKHDKILEGISEDRIGENPPEDRLIVVDGGGVLFYDSFSGRYFEATMERVKRAINDFNYELLDEMWKEVNEFYDFIGLEHIEAGRRVGWRIEEGKLEVRFDAKIVNAPDSRWHDEPCIVMSYPAEPRFL